MVISDIQIKRDGQMPHFISLSSAFAATSAANLREHILLRAFIAITMKSGARFRIWYESTYLQPKRRGFTQQSTEAADISGDRRASLSQR